MSFPIRIRPQAHAELKEAHDWYEDASPGLGDKYLAALDHVFEQIRENPRRFAGAYGFRRAVTETFPYCVYYSVERDHIVVVAVFHGRRNPSKLRDRG